MTGRGLLARLTRSTTALPINAALQAMALVGPDGRLRHANPAWQHLLGHSLSDGLQHDDAALLRRALDDCLGDRAPEPLPDLRLRSNPIPTLRLHLRRLPDGALLIAEDRGEIAILQVQLAQSQRLQAVGAFTGGIGHDFNNLLGAVLGAVDAMQDRAGLDADTRADLAIIRASAERGADLVRQLLAFGGQQTLRPVVLATNPAIEAVAALLHRLLPASVRAHITLEAPGRFVLIDPTQFDQILLNLAVNARDAMPTGGDLAITSGHATVLQPLPGLPDTVAPGRYVTVEVRDTGPGIPPAILPRVFEPFFTTKRDAGGTGLGLATVLGIVHQSGGFLTVTTGPDGTHFRLYFPRHAAPPADPSPPPPLVAPPVARAGGVVLLVDDEDALRQLAERLLIRRGWTVLSAEDAAMALDLLTETPAIDAIVTDLVMPGLDGAALVREVRSRLARPDLPAILVSGYAEAALREQIGAVATAFMAKPYRLADLADKLADLTRPAG